MVELLEAVLYGVVRRLMRQSVASARGVKICGRVMSLGFGDGGAAINPKNKSIRHAIYFDLPLDSKAPFVHR
jgi:hypothetical protein